MAELKQGRWVKVHEPGQANFVENENVMDIVIGAGRCQANATYTVRSYKKAAYWPQSRRGAQNRRRRGDGQDPVRRG